MARGELRISTINSPMTFATSMIKPTVLIMSWRSSLPTTSASSSKSPSRQNISQLFDDLDEGKADMLAAGLVYNSERVKNYQVGPTYYSVSQQLVYRKGNLRPRPCKHHRRAAGHRSRARGD
jgi:membrane-bound lytic murein transglycosylase F